MFQVRKTLGVGNLELKIEKRTLERIGQVSRMKNDKVVKQITLGWPVIWRIKENTVKQQLTNIERQYIEQDWIMSALKIW